MLILGSSVSSINKVREKQKTIAINQNKVSVSTTLTIRSAGAGEMYKTRKKTHVIYKDDSDGKYYCLLDSKSEGDPISCIIHFNDQDVETLTMFSVVGKQVKFANDEDISGLNATITYLYIAN